MSRKKIALVLVLVLAPVLYFGLSASNDTPDNFMNAEQAVAAVNVQTRLMPPAMIALPASNKQAQVSLSTNADVAPEEPMSTIERIRAIQDKTEMHQALLKDYDQFKRYPENNQRIHQTEQDPLIKGYAIDERTTVSEDKTAALTVWSDQKYYLRGDLVTVQAYITNDKGTRIPSNYAAQLIFDESKSIQQLELQDKDGDSIYETSFIADQVNEKDLLAGIYKVLIMSDTSELIDSVAFVLADPEATFTGNYRDSLTSDGSLKIEAEVEVTSKDRFYFQASLYTELGDPIGGNQMTLNLDKGKSWVPFEFYGLMMHDSKVGGPYLLKNLSLARVTMPMQRAPLIHPNYYTQPYELSVFSNQKYADVASLK